MSDMGNQKTENLTAPSHGISCHVADLPPGCLEKIHDFERELNRQGCWNIALVAYQLNG